MIRQLSLLSVLALGLLPCAAMADDYSPGTAESPAVTATDSASKDKTSSNSSETPAREFTIVMHNREFDPLELVVPASTELKIHIKNEDMQPIEFRSTQLDRFKIIQPNTTGTIEFHPLMQGTYSYYDNFNGDAKGFITVQ